MAEVEARRGPSVPVLVHTDLRLVDKTLAVLKPSFAAYQRIRPGVAEPLANLLLQNFVTGCTVAANRSLVRMACPLPREAIMHDWWLALCAAAAGEIAYLRTPTVSYRQHSANVVGARGFWRAIRHHLCAGIETRPLLDDAAQAAALRERLEERGVALPHHRERLLSGIAALAGSDAPGLGKVVRALRSGCRPQGPARRVLFLTRLGVLCLGAGAR